MDSTKIGVTVRALTFEPEGNKLVFSPRTVSLAVNENAKNYKVANKEKASEFANRKGMELDTKMQTEGKIADKDIEDMNNKKEEEKKEIEKDKIQKEMEEKGNQPII